MSFLTFFTLHTFPQGPAGPPGPKGATGGIGAPVSMMISSYLKEFWWMLDSHPVLVWSMCRVLLVSLDLLAELDLPAPL